MKLSFWMSQRSTCHFHIITSRTKSALFSKKGCGSATGLQEIQEKRKQKGVFTS